MKNKKLARKNCPEEEEDDGFFTCFVCDDSFSSMKLLCLHMRNHREKDSNGIQQSIPSQERSSSETETIVLKTEETMPDQDASKETQSRAADSYKTDSESAVEPQGNTKQIAKIKMSLMPQVFESHISNKSKSSSSHGGLKNPKRAKAVKSVHQCEICGRTFGSGQALGGHKTYHREKAGVDPFRGGVLIVQRKAKEQLCGETSGQVSDRFTRLLLPRELSGEAYPSEESSFNSRP